MTVKTHFQRNKKLYLGLTIGASVGAGVSIAFTRSTYINNGIQAGFAWKPVNEVVINLVERSTPSKPVHLVGTNLYFSSLSEAARATGHHLSMISKNVNKIIPDVKGDVFELLELAS